ncbi:MAG TPA: isochorismatase family protein [Patescibacteria group bacterium]|nr:isochorismatase family protein [Patescibacteria group bacterium]
MASRDIVFWDVDTQRDFMLPGGKLYVPGAERLIPRIESLVNLAREGRVLLISSVDAHTPDDPEFRDWPPHCVQGTPGQRKIPETLTGDLLLVPNHPEFHLPCNLWIYKQIIVEKQTLDDFDNPNTERILKQLGADAEYCVFGVVTEYCVRLAVMGLLKRGFHVAVVTDAIMALDEEEGRRSIAEFVSAGAQLLETGEAVALVEAAGHAGAD